MSEDKKKPNFKILPVKTDGEEKKDPNIPEPIPQGNFTMVMVAPTKSGKTVTICNLLYRAYKNHYDEVIYISPTIDLDKTLSKNVKKDDDLVKISDKEDLKNIDHIIEELVESQKQKGDERKKILVILDDMIGYFKKTKSTLDDTPALSRHYSISFIIVTQVFTALPPRLKKNAHYFLIFKIINKYDLEQIEKQIGCNFENFEELYKEATKDKYNFLYLDNSEMKAYKNFEELLWSKY